MKFENINVNLWLLSDHKGKASSGDNGIVCCEVLAFSGNENILQFYNASKHLMTKDGPIMEQQDLFVLAT